MRFATVRELSTGTSQLLKKVDEDKAVIITKFGKPRYLLVEIQDDDLEDYILAKHYNLEREFKKAQGDLKTRRTKSLADLIGDGSECGQ